MPNIIVPVAATGLPSITPTMRRRMERAVERLIAALDALDEPLAEIEPDEDLEPVLGAPEVLFVSRDADQSRWAKGGDCDEREAEDEHGGDVLNEPHDAEADEPNLGAAENAHDQTRWSQGGLNADECEIDENGRRARYISTEHSQANRAAACAAERQAHAIVDRKHHRRAHASDNIIPLRALVLPFVR